MLQYVTMQYMNHGLVIATTANNMYNEYMFASKLVSMLAHFFRAARPLLYVTTLHLVEDTRGLACPWRRLFDDAMLYDSVKSSSLYVSY